MTYCDVLEHGDADFDRWLLVLAKGFPFGKIANVGPLEIPDDLTPAEHFCTLCGADESGGLSVIYLVPRPERKIVCAKCLRAAGAAGR